MYAPNALRRHADRGSRCSFAVAAAAAASLLSAGVSSGRIRQGPLGACCRGSPSVWRSPPRPRAAPRARGCPGRAWRRFVLGSPGTRRSAPRHAGLRLYTVVTTTSSTWRAARQFPDETCPSPRSSPRRGRVGAIHGRAGRLRRDPARAARAWRDPAQTPWIALPLWATGVLALPRSRRSAAASACRPIRRSRCSPRAAGRRAAGCSPSSTRGCRALGAACALRLGVGGAPLARVLDAETTSPPQGRRRGAGASLDRAVRPGASACGAGVSAGALVSIALLVAQRTAVVAAAATAVTLLACCLRRARPRGGGRDAAR